MNARWFAACLRAIADLPPERRPRSIAFPERVGCGLAGGDWAHYEAMIEEFAARHDGKIAVVICRLADEGGGGRSGGVDGDGSREGFERSEPAHCEDDFLGVRGTSSFLRGNSNR